MATGEYRFVGSVVSQEVESDPARGRKSRRALLCMRPQLNTHSILLPAAHKLIIPSNESFLLELGKDALHQRLGGNLVILVFESRMTNSKIDVGRKVDPATVGAKNLAFKIRVDGLDDREQLLGQGVHLGSRYQALDVLCKQTTA